MPAAFADCEGGFAERRRHFVRAEPFLAGLLAHQVPKGGLG